MSAHREPDKVADYARNAKLRGLRVIIAGAGLSAALPGVVAAHSELPVIGVPLTSKTSVAGGLKLWRVLIARHMIILTNFVRQMSIQLRGRTLSP